MSDITVSQSFAIQEPVEIDDMLLRIAAIDSEIEHYEALLKHRTSVIKQEIEKLEGVKAQYRDAIKGFMAANNEKTLNYPGVGKVTRKSAQRKWIVNDESAMLPELQAGYPELYDRCVKQVPKVEKKELNKVLDTIHSAGTTLSGVELQEGEETLSVSFVKEDAMLDRVKETKGRLHDESAPATKGEYDGLDFT